MTDPIADMLTRIRNALAVNKPEVFMPYSKMKEGIAVILKDYDYIEGFEKTVKGGHDQLRIVLRYSKPRVPAISNMKRVSTPGKRMYVSKEKIPTVLQNFGIAIISTSQGLMANHEARKRRLGGEIVCEIY